MSAETDEVRLYGNWRRPDSRGLKGLGTIGTMCLIMALGLSAIVMITRGPIDGLIVSAVAGLLILLLIAKDKHGKSALTRVNERLGWMAARRAGSHLYRSGPLARHTRGKHQLPGVLAATELSECTDSYHRRFALLHLARGRYSVVIAGSPDGAAAVDREQIDEWVAHYGHWLSGLADEPGLVAAAVTIESGPFSTTELERRVIQRLDPDAPAFAREVMVDVVRDYPEDTHTVRAWITLTYDGRGAKPDVVGREIATRLPHLTRELESCGAGVTRPCTADDVCRLVRVAYDPAATPTLDQALVDGDPPELGWSDVGPAAAQAAWDHYRHDSGLSVTWEMTEAPRGAVRAQVLARLLSPHRDVPRKRVTLLYRPIDASRAEKAVEDDLDAAEFRQNSAGRATARASLAVQRAAKTAMEEASGAGLVNFGLLVTATVQAEEDLARARAAVETTLRASARLRLRPVYGAQDSAFAAALPLGIVLPDLLALPSDVREKL
jgi:hypothetical protein